ncbi:MAG: tetratricopeptide repeat protein [Pseudomonadota bacterium]
MSRLLLLLLTGPLLMAALPSLAAPGDTSATDARQLLQEGVVAFERGELAQARRLLEQARESGLESSALYYNLGVLYYRTGDYQRSRQAFRQLLGTEHEDLAGYNLGLVALADGDENTARVWFGQVLDTAGQEKLRRLAGRQLQILNHSQSPAPAQWLGLAALSGGYESNLALRPDSVASDLSDSFTDVLLAGRGPVITLGATGSSAEEVQLSASVFRRHYHTERDFITDAAQLGVSWVSRNAAERYEIGVEQRFFREGGDSRELHTSLVLEYQQDGCADDYLGGRCQLALEASYVRPFDGFEPYEGMRYEAVASYQHRWARWQAAGSLGLEFNRREDLAGDGQFASLSPRRQELGLELSYLGWSAWTVGGALGYRYSDYPDPYQIAPDTGWESGRRVDHRYTAELTAEYFLARSWSVVASASHHSNDSSLQQYDYDNEVYRLGIDYLF